MEDQEPEHEQEGTDRDGRREDPTQCTATLVVAGGTAHEDPRLIHAAQDREIAEEQNKQRYERDEDSEADTAGEIVGLRAEPQAGELLVRVEACAICGIFRP